MTLAIIISCAFLLVGVHWIVKIALARRWMVAARQKPLIRSKRTVYVLIPVLEETGRLENTVNYFLRTFKNAIIVVITTAREPPGDSTITLARKLAGTRVLHLHYPGAGDKMAHQLNYGMRQLPKDGIFGVYNADSRPDPRTLRWVERAFADGAEVCQQYGNYTRNIAKLGPVLVAAAAWQNRWAIGFEIPHALRQFTRTAQMNYCIGHGLFYTRQVYNRVGGFSETMHNEDAIFGLELSYLGIPIHPVPYFDRCDTADSVVGFLKQQSNWFFGPTQSLRYYRVLREKYDDKARLAVLCFKLFCHAVYWIAGPTLLVLATGVAIASMDVLAISIVVGTAFVYLSLLNIVALRTSDWRVIFKGVLGSPAMYLLHGVAALCAIGKMAAALVFGRTVVKGKTPMGARSAA